MIATILEQAMDLRDDLINRSLADLSHLSFLRG